MNCKPTSSVRTVTERGWHGMSTPACTFSRNTLIQGNVAVVVITLGNTLDDTPIDEKGNRYFLRIFYADNTMYLDADLNREIIFDELEITGLKYSKITTIKSDLLMNINHDHAVDLVISKLDEL